MSNIGALRNRHFQGHAMRQISSAKPDVVAFYLPDPKGQTANGYEAVMDAKSNLRNEQHREGGHYVIYCNHAAKNWHRVDKLLPNALVSKAQGCCLGLQDPDTY